MKHIVLETCGAIASLGFLPGCEKLEGIGFFETNVQDGNIGQLLQLPVLSFVGMNDKQTIPTQNPKSIGNKRAAESHGLGKANAECARYGEVSECAIGQLSGATC